MAQTFGRITIDNGIVTVGGKQVGTVMQDLKFGYHPCVAIRTEGSDKVDWLELDERDLIGKVWVIVRERLEAEKII